MNALVPGGFNFGATSAAASAPAFGQPPQAFGAFGASGAVGILTTA